MRPQAEAPQLIARGIIGILLVDLLGHAQQGATLFPFITHRRRRGEERRAQDTVASGAVRGLCRSGALAVLAQVPLQGLDCRRIKLGRPGAARQVGQSLFSGYLVDGVKTASIQAWQRLS
ncbi:hypothetical protein D3C79_782680 [compost metagenome]